MIDKKRKLVFLHLHGTDGSSVEASLLNDPRLVEHDGNIRQTLTQNLYRDEFLGLDHPNGTLAEHGRALGKQFSSYTVFTMVRNIYAAYVSHFFYLNRFRDQSFFTPKNFEAFVELCEHSYRFRSYEYIIGGLSGELYIRELLDFMQLEIQLADFTRRKIGSELVFSRPKLPQNDVPDFQTFLTPWAIEKISKRHSYDIARFNWLPNSDIGEIVTFGKLGLRVKLSILAITCIRQCKRIFAGVISRIKQLKLIPERRLSLSVARIGTEYLRNNLSSLLRSRLAYRPSTTENIFATMCTTVSRSGMAKFAVQTILPQVDHLYVYLNDFDEIPPYLISPKITAVLGSAEAGDLGSNGKFFHSQVMSGYHIILDDDIAYPPDYVSRMIEKIEYYCRRNVVCVHGSVFQFPFESYYRSRIILQSLQALSLDIRVDIASTGTVAYHTDAVRFSLDEFKSPNMDDVFFSMKCLNENIAMIAIERKRNWLLPLFNVRSGDTIWGQRHLYDEQCTNVVKNNFSAVINNSFDARKANSAN